MLQLLTGLVFLFSSLKQCTLYLDNIQMTCLDYVISSTNYAMQKCSFCSFMRNHSRLNTKQITLHNALAVDKTD